MTAAKRAIIGAAAGVAMVLVTIGVGEIASLIISAMAQFPWQVSTTLYMATVAAIAGAILGVGMGKR